ncbi:hypothetical protein F3Y22_tig00112399pilonHSYRG00012 [Hibiscus syriacus]|uniref:Lipoyl-binding domain-containing protein n=1 Tax=Hibiscus syriacus TaxID=106335 RepID=A0A6A2XYJ8_HIBSY|nr:hypothetical protein F3Y22_tig00112399pilonHSYRG00012 [Hibiscus syriacus]
MGFDYTFVRDLAGKSEPLPAIASPPVRRIQSFLDKDADEGLVILQSPMVGFFRRSRTIKGKRTPPSCKEKQIVKEGQVLCYIEQLGGEIPIESDVSGEVIKILRDDGGFPLLWKLGGFNSIFVER